MHTVARAVLTDAVASWPLPAAHTHTVASLVEPLSNAGSPAFTKALMILRAIGSSGPPKGRESHKWEPKQSAAPGLSPTQPECPPRSKPPHSTQSDGDRHQKPP